jgi:hypothetical protein
MINPTRASEEVRDPHTDLRLASKATVLRDLGYGNRLIEGDVLEIYKVA